MKKHIEQMPQILTKKCPTKNVFFKRNIFFIGPPLPLNEFRVGMDMGKKMAAPKKLKKREKKSCFAPYTQFFHIVGGSRTSKTSNSSSNSNNSSNIY